MAGSGKTELALKAASSLAAHYGAARLFVDLQPSQVPIAPSDILEAVVRQLEPRTRVAETMADLEAQYRQLLAGRRGLLVLDNAANKDQVRAARRVPDGWGVLVTSREVLTLRDARLVELGRLEPEAAHSFLQHRLEILGRAGDAGQENQLAALAELCCHLPLALRIAADHLAMHAHQPLATYLEDLRSSRLRHLEEADDSVAHVIGESVSRLEREHKDTWLRWHALAVFPAPFDVSAAAAVWDVDIDEASSTLVACRRRSLLRASGSNGLFRLHDLYREYALGNPHVRSDVWATWRMSHAQHYLKQGAQAVDLYGKGGTSEEEAIRLYGRLRPHLDTAWRWSVDRDDEDALRYVSEYPLRLALLFDLFVKPADQLSYWEAALGAAQRVGNRKDEAKHWGHLGRVSAQSGRFYRTEEYYHRALEIDRERGDTHNEQIHVANLAAAYFRQGRIAEALPRYLQALDLAVAKGNDTAAAINAYNIGACYESRGYAEEAHAYYRQALDSSYAQASKRMQAACLTMLGSTLVLLGRTGEAMTEFDAALSLARAAHDLSREANILINRGEAHQVDGDLQAAIKCYKAAYELASDSDPRNAACAISRMGEAYVLIGDLGTATHYLDEALRQTRAIEYKTEEVRAAWNRGLVHEQLQEYGQAVELMQERVEHEAELDHRDADANAGRLDDVRLRAAAPPQPMTRGPSAE